MLHSFNCGGFLVSAHVVGNEKGPNAVLGTVSEQFGEAIPGQYLPSGATQAFFCLDQKFSTLLNKAGQNFIKGGINIIIDPIKGMQFIFRRTGWSDANGIWGYLSTPGPATIQTTRVGSRENASKKIER